jgi:hypothetical protein
MGSQSPAGSLPEDWRLVPPTHEVFGSGTWKELIEYPGRFLITGDAGSGKTTLLLHEAQRLCAEAQAGANIPLPIYVSLRGFSSENEETLLEMAAEATSSRGGSRKIRTRRRYSPTPQRDFVSHLAPRGAVRGSEAMPSWPTIR